MEISICEVTSNFCNFALCTLRKKYGKKTKGSKRMKKNQNTFLKLIFEVILVEKRTPRINDRQLSSMHPLIVDYYIFNFFELLEKS